VAKVVELWEEVTWAQAATVMAGARATQAERIAWERVVLLASAHGEADKVAWRASLLVGELTVVRQAWDAAQVKLPSLVEKAAATDR
jgi:hypothetical protein